MSGPDRSNNVSFYNCFGQYLPGIDVPDIIACLEKMIDIDIFPCYLLGYHHTFKERSTAADGAYKVVEKGRTMQAPTNVARN
jgi:hypothetical protein